MIWARPLCSTDAAALWIRSSLTPQGVGLLRSGLELPALVTGLDDASRELLAELVGAAWVGGSGDAAVIRCSPLLLESWISRLRPTLELRFALERLRHLDAPRAATSLGGRPFAWGTRTFVMGIINVTPDSFSDGGRHLETAAAIAHGQALAKAGADLLDVGGESTRPGAAPVSEADELARVVPVIEGLRSTGVPISIDTVKPVVARAAIAAGATLVNDVSGLREDAMISVIAETGASACVMHLRGTPETMQSQTAYDDVGGEVLDALELALRRATAGGIGRDKLWVDPGIGFAKTASQNLFLMQRAIDLRLLGAPVLWGVSRKAFLGGLTGGKPAPERVVASAAAAAVLAATGAVDVVRVHDVEATRDALAVADAVRAARDGGARFHG